MDIAEELVETYLRHVMKLATVANVRCEDRSQKEIDLIAIGTCPADRYHVEVNGTIDPTWKRLTQATATSLIPNKFDHSAIVASLAEYGFVDGGYKKVLVCWDWNADAKRIAEDHSVELWKLPDLMTGLLRHVGGKTIAYPQCTLRLLQLLATMGLSDLNGS